MALEPAFNLSSIDVDIPAAWQEMAATTLQDDAHFKVVVHGRFPKTEEERKAIVWDSRIVAELLSSSGDKLMDNIRASRRHHINLRSVNMDAFVEDSEEKEPTFVYIALGKIAVSGKPFEEMNDQEKEALCRKLGVPDVRYILLVSEDRGQFIDKRIKDAAVFDAYREHPLLKEVFAPGADFPAHRFKELQQAMGGLGPFMEAVDWAIEHLPKDGSAFYSAEYYQGLSPENRQHSEHIAYAFKPLVESEIIPIDKDGVVIEITQKKCRTISMSPEEIAQEQNGEKTFEGFNFVIPPRQGGVQVPQSMQSLRTDPFNAWFEENSYWAKAWEIFCEMYNVPQRDVPLQFEPLPIPDASFLVVGNPDRRAIKGLNGSRKPVVHNVLEEDPASSPAVFEQALAGARGAVLLPYKNLSNALDEALVFADQLRTAATLITLKSLYDPLMSGCPIVVGDRKLATKLRFLTNTFYQHKFFGCKPEEMFVEASSKNARLRGLRWDPLWYKELDPANIPSVSYYSQEDIENITGVSDTRYTRSVLVTASCLNDVVIRDAEIAGYDSAVYGEAIVSGGGTRNGMGAVVKGGAQAFHDGYRDFFQHGERWGTVAVKEGSVSGIPEEFGLVVTGGDLQSEFVRFEEWLTFHQTESYAARKSVITGRPMAAFPLGGGWGTGDEWLDASVHNGKVLKYGYGHRPGYHDDVVGDKNKLPIAIRFIDSSLQAGRKARFYSIIANRLFTEDQQSMLAMHFYGNVREGLDEDRHYAKKLGYPVERRRPVEKPSGRWILHSSPSLIRT